MLQSNILHFIYKKTNVFVFNTGCLIKSMLNHQTLDVSCTSHNFEVSYIRGQRNCVTPSLARASQSYASHQ